MQSLVTLQHEISVGWSSKENSVSDADALNSGFLVNRASMAAQSSRDNMRVVTDALA